MSIQSTINRSIGLAAVVGQRAKEKQEQAAMTAQKTPSFPQMARVLAHEIAKQEAAMQAMKQQKEAKKKQRTNFETYLTRGRRDAAK